jgi:hypothetical protein
MARPLKLPIEVSDLNLAPRELKFIGEYCTSGFNETEAFKKSHYHSGMSNAEMRLSALEILNKREVKIAVERFVSSVLDPYRDKIEYQILEVLRSRAFYDVSWYYHADGSVKKLDEIDRDARHAIDSILEDYRGKDAQVRLVNYKLADKMQAQKALQELLKKNQTQEEGVLPEDARKQISEVFAGALAGIAMSQVKTARGAKQEPKQGITHEPLQTIPMDVVEPDTSPEVEASPVVQKAKEFAKKETSGLLVNAHPLVQQARDAVRGKRNG